MQTNNWLEGNRLPVVTIVRFVFCWCEELVSIDFRELHLSISKNTFTDYSMYMSEICVFAVSREGDNKIGSENVIVDRRKPISLKEEQRWKGHATTVDFRRFM